jgi:hypothetical protein
MSLQKTNPHRSKNLRNSARGQDCTLNVVGVCNYQSETTVLAHLPDESGTAAVGSKTDDWCACFACSDCHRWIDGYEGGKGERFWYIRRAMIRTWRKWIEMGLININ